MLSKKLIEVSLGVGVILLVCVGVFIVLQRKATRQQSGEMQAVSPVAALDYQVEPETGSIIGPAVLGSDTSASGGQYIQFGGVSTQQGSPYQPLEVATDPSFREIKVQLIPGFPSDFPVHPGAKLEASAKTNPENKPNTGYRAHWVTQDSVVTVMRWYEKEFPKSGWTYEVPNDPHNTGEQVAQIKKGNLTGYIAAEKEGNAVEIVVEVRFTGQ